MTREEAKQVFLDRGFVNGIFDGDKWRQSIVIISKWLEQEPCEDCISRQAVINGVDNYIKKVQSTGAKDDFISFEELVVKALPPVTPKPKTGHWRAVYQGDEIINYRCTECEFGNTFGRNTHRMNFCPNCGAKMEE